MTNQQLKAHCEDVIANPQDHLDWVVDMAKEALAALTQPVSQALKLPLSIEPEDVPGLIDPTANPDEYACCVGKDVWDACLREVAKLNAPHTAPIEPICATGGVKVPEGWSLVPNEATREMIEEGDQWELSENIWNAMIGVAPKP